MNECNLGMVRGMIVDVEDPLKLCRVKVRIPIIHGVLGSDNFRVDDELPWAYPSLPPNMQQVPKVKDFVWIMFENNDVSMPVYLGVVLGKQSLNPEIPIVLGSGKGTGVQSIPSSYEAPYNGNNAGTIFESVGGFKITYDDGVSPNGSDGVLSIAKENMSIDAKDDSVTINVHDNTLIINSDSIEGTVGTNKLIITNDNVNVGTGSNNLTISEDGFTLSVGGGSISLTNGSIVISLGGSSITLTESMLTLISPTIHENP